MNILIKSLRFFLAILSVPTVFPSQVLSLPIGFGYNQGDLEFMEFNSKNFRVYFDKRAPNDAKIALQSLEAAKPSLERWFEVRRSSPLIVNMSAASQNASFANFITDSIELQTLGQGGRDLALHEYTHSMMYRHLDNLLGPAGAILHLPWMEAWFLEGLAEALSVSIGSDEQAGIERYQALTNNWPSWDRLHSLYTGGPFSYRGYATSGAFVAWILRTHDATKLPDMLRTFRTKSMPWYWPWGITPLNGFLPMDSALESFTGKSGRDLYEHYKTEATKYWKSEATSPILLQDIKKNETTKSAWSWIVEENKIKVSTPPPGAASVQFAKSGKTTSWTSDYFPAANQERYRLALADGESRPQWLNRGSYWIDGPWLTSTHVWWQETYVEKSQVCAVPRRKFKKEAVSCSLSADMPQRLRHLGSQQDTKTGLTKVLWFAQDLETLRGNVHKVIEINLESGHSRFIPLPVGGQPISMATAKKSGIWMLTADRSWRHLVKVNSKEDCEGIVEISDFPVRILDSETERPHAVLYSADGYVARELDPAKFPLKPCRQLSKKTSPILESIQSRNPLSFKDAMDSASIWTNRNEPSSGVNIAKKSEAAATNSAESLSVSNDPEARPASWRGRPVFAFPWIGADDAMGPQIGVISVPLMDHMQNETLRATALVGTVSRFPYQDLTLTTNRFSPTWSISGFRAQTYNGRYKEKSTGNILSGFLEEAGVRLDGSLSQRWKYLTLGYDWGFKSSHLKPYIGPTKRKGQLNEPYGDITASVTNGGKLYAQASIRARLAPAGLNEVYQYDVLGSSLSGGVMVGRGKIEAGLEASRTRGPNRRDLQEMYQPLKTLIPGSGAGYNQNSFGLTADHGLFSPKFGENQARARLLATHPIIESFDKFAALIYIDQLSASGFFNYGTAWRGSDSPSKSSLIAAHGYSLDLFMDNKGVRFNFGLGTGQVLGRSWQGYWTFGFDALF